MKFIHSKNVNAKRQLLLAPVRMLAHVLGAVGVPSPSPHSLHTSRITASELCGRTSEAQISRENHSTLVGFTDVVIGEASPMLFFRTCIRLLRDGDLLHKFYPYMGCDVSGGYRCVIERASELIRDWFRGRLINK